MKKKILYKKGDVFSSPELYLAHGCNNRGVMGSGVARVVKEQYREAYEFYASANRLSLGDILPYKCNGKIIINCITQNGYGRDNYRYVSYDAIEMCIKEINTYVSLDTPVAMPQIGAGLGGGNWNIIATIIEETATFQPMVYQL